jgi:hypothetical protein
MQISSPRTEEFLSAVERGLGAFFLASAATCYAGWYTGRGQHGEIAFLWLYSSAALPIGIGMFAAGQALRSRWPRRWLWQFAVLLPVLAWLAWFRITLLRG